MAIRASLTLCAIASLLVGGVAFAQQPGTTTGPAVGKNVEPNTATQKSYESEQQRLERRSAGGGIGGGRPGIEAMPGTQGGPEGQPGK
jgi:hypothetical protein